MRRLVADADALIRVMETTWKDHWVHGAEDDVFAVPPALDTRDPDPEAMVAAITRFWTPGRATRALSPVLAKLLDLSRRFPPDERLSASS